MSAVLRRWGAASVAALLAVGGCAQAADVQGVINPIARPSEVDGQRIGCDLSFHVGRGPLPGDWREGIGATVTWVSTQGRTAVALKIGYQPASGVVVAPATAFLGHATSNNRMEIIQQNPSTNAGYINLVFAPGDQTLSVLEGFERTGVMGVGIEKPDGEVMVWTLDLTAHPQVRADWARCLSTLS